MHLLRTMSQSFSRKLLIYRYPKSAMEDEHTLITCLYTSVYFKYMVRITKWANLRQRTRPDVVASLALLESGPAKLTRLKGDILMDFEGRMCAMNGGIRHPIQSPTSPLTAFYEGIKTHGRQRRPKKISTLRYLTPRNSHQISPCGHETRVDSNQYLSTSSASCLVA